MINNNKTDKHMQHNTPDLKIVDKKVWTVEVAIPKDSKIEEKEMEKIIKYKIC